MPDATAVTAALNFIHAINARSEDTLAALMTDDHEFIDSGGESWQGRALMRKNWREYFRLFPDYTITLKRVRLHQSRVVLRGVSSGALSAYGQETLRRADGTLPADTDLQGPAIWTALAKGSKVAQWRVYGDTPEVRAALNLKVAATPIAIVDYDPAWPEHFAVEAARLQRAIGQQAVAIEHIGSTSVPGLAAKPTIDIMVGVETLADADRCVPPVVALGYTYAPEHEGAMPYRRYFSRSGTPNWHIHMVATSHAFWARHLDFRDYLRAHAADADAYAALKRRLAREYGADRGGYTDAKTAFITGVETKARAWRAES